MRGRNLPFPIALTSRGRYQQFDSFLSDVKKFPDETRRCFSRRFRRRRMLDVRVPCTRKATSGLRERLCYRLRLFMRHYNDLTPRRDSEAVICARFLCFFEKDSFTLCCLLRLQ